LESCVETLFDDIVFVIVKLLREFTQWQILN